MTAPAIDDRPIPEDRAVVLAPLFALRLIASRGCEVSTLGLGSCIIDGRSPLAREGARQACAPCVAFAAVQQVVAGR